MQFHITLLIILQCISLNFSFESDTLFILKGQLTKDSFLIYPTDLDTYKDGSFVLKELRQQELKLFDKYGNYIKTITKRGRGPGEFLDIDYFYIDDKENLIVVDHKQLKITKIRRNLSKKDYLAFESRPRVRSIQQKKNGNYIIGFRDYSQRTGLKKEALFYDLDSEFKISKKGFVHPTELTDDEPGTLPRFVLDSSINLSVNSVLTTNNELLVAPIVYSGFLFNYKNDNNSFTNPVTIKASSYGKSYVEFEGSKEAQKRKILSNKEPLYLLSNMAGSRAFYILNKSLGLYKLNSGKIVHFVQKWEENKPTLVVELINEDASEVIGTKRIKTLGDLDISKNLIMGQEYGMIHIDFLHLDNQDRLFIAKINDQDEAELHVIQIDIEIF